MTFIPCLPEAIDQTILRFKIIEGQNPELDNAIHDTLSSMFNFLMNMTLFPPILGGIIYDQFDYHIAMDGAAIFMLILTIIQFNLNCGCKVFEEHKKEQEQLE